MVTTRIIRTNALPSRLRKVLSKEVSGYMSATNFADSRFPGAATAISIPTSAVIRTTAQAILATRFRQARIVPAASTTQRLGATTRGAR